MSYMTLRPQDAPEEETLYAAKIVTYAPPVPEGRVANTNPRIERLLLDGRRSAPTHARKPALADDRLPRAGPGVAVRNASAAHATR